MLLLSRYFLLHFKAWNALMANSIQVATINGIGDFILFLGKLAVGLICGLVSVLLLRNREDVHFYTIPCIFIGVFAFFIAHIILSLFEVMSQIYAKLKSIFIHFTILKMKFQLFPDGGWYAVPVCMWRSCYKWPTRAIQRV